MEEEDKEEEEDKVDGVWVADNTDENSERAPFLLKIDGI
jgi:hypothetical protein